MAKDATRLLGHLDIDKAHAVGASMGGMISQRLAIDHPARVRSLCSIMSTTGNPEVGGADEGVYEALAEEIPPDREEAIDHVVALFTLIGSKTYAAEEAPNRRALATAGYDRSLGHPGGGVRQVAAIALALGRTAALQKLTVPTLVIHGNENSLINISGGHATHKTIPGAVWYGHPENGAEGMGHDLPLPLLDGIAAGILAHLERGQGDAGDTRRVASTARNMDPSWRAPKGRGHPAAPAPGWPRRSAPRHDDEGSGEAISKAAGIIRL